MRSVSPPLDPRIGRGSEVVVIDAVSVVLTRLGVEPHRHGHAGVALADQHRVVEPVVLAVHHHPEVRLVALGVVEAVYDDLCDPGVVGKVLLGSAERDHVVGRGVAVPEHQAGHDQMVPRDAQVRPPGNNDLTPGLGSQRYGPVGQTLGCEDDLEIAPLAIGEDDRVTGPRRPYGLPVLVLGVHQRLGT